MAFEIERKFLVRSEEWRSLATGRARIRQAYLASGERSSTRVRIKDDTDATVTIKSKGAELRRLEVEYAIAIIDAEALLSLRQSGLVEKLRFTVPWHGHVWEVDTFCGDNAGLVIAEIELRHEEETFPAGLAGRGGHRTGAVLQRVAGAAPFPSLVDRPVCCRRLSNERLHNTIDTYHSPCRCRAMILHPRRDRPILRMVLVRERSGRGNGVRLFHAQ